MQKNKVFSAKCCYVEGKIKSFAIPFQTTFSFSSYGRKCKFSFSRIPSFLSVSVPCSLFYYSICRCIRRTCYTFAFIPPYKTTPIDLRAINSSCTPAYMVSLYPFYLSLPISPKHNNVSHYTKPKSSNDGQYESIGRKCHNNKY